MVEELKLFAENLVKSLCLDADLVKVQDFTDEDNIVILEIMVSENDMGKVIGRQGKMAKAIRTLIQATAYNKGIKRVNINIDSF